MQDVSGWIAAGLTFSALLFNERRHSRSRSTKTLDERLKPLETAIALSDANHAKHFLSGVTTGLAVARVEQRIDDHESTCQERMVEIRAMFTEIRSRLNGNGK